MLYHPIRCELRAIALLTVILAGIPVALTNSASGQAGEISPGGPNRVWLGPEFFANRLQDWQWRNGRIECVESRQNFPLRTVHVLTRTLSSKDGDFELRVRLGAVNTEVMQRPDAWAGFLIGAGNENVDYRISSMVHHRPAEDGGILALVNGAGHTEVRSNSQASATGNQWSIGGAINEDDVPLLDRQVNAGDGFENESFAPVELVLAGAKGDQGYNLALSATQIDGLKTISLCGVTDVDPSLIDGNIAIVSHLGPVDVRDAGFWFDDLVCTGTKIQRHDDRIFGPIVSVMYTVSDSVLKLTAQSVPLGEEDSTSARLMMRRQPGAPWTEVAATEFEPDSCTFPFRVEHWDSSRPVEYRVTYDLDNGGDEPIVHEFAGTIAAEPWDTTEFVLGVLTCQKIYTGGLKWNENGIWFPHTEIVNALSYHEPDLLFFNGDQIYEGDLTPAIRQPVETAIHDYLYKWYRHCWSFRDLMANVPTVCIPDDHDVYHGNIWGAGNEKAPPDDRYRYQQDRGGYTMPPRFVNAVHATQTSHLPDPVDPEPIGGGISVYFTRLEWAGVSCAIFGDRQFKSAPAVVLPDAGVVNGWFQNADFDPVTQADAPDAKLLGDRQLRFLRDWATDWSHQAWMKVAMSQTIFSNVATIPESATSGSVIPSLPYLEPGEYPDGYKKAADCDSNAWPQTGRNRAINELRRAFAFHLAGDQHLASTIRYGINEFNDAGYAFCVPAVANTWPRRWFPPEEGANRNPDAPRYTGEFFDGFGNRMTIHAVANPFRTGRQPANLYDRVPGYGIVRLDRSTREVTFECWPRWIDPEVAAENDQFSGWPIRFHQRDNYARTPAAYLPTLEIIGLDQPIVQVINEDTGEIEYTWRLTGTSFQPQVFSASSHTVRVGDPDRGLWRELKNLSPQPQDAVNETIRVEF